MREILVNALTHRDYSISGGAVSLAVFDDRVEVWSAGKFPNGITPESLTRAHLSVQRNPIIAEVFYRTGLIEKWGRGTNRVAEMCTAAGITAPDFEEITGAAVVTFRVPVVGAESRAELLDERILEALYAGEQSKSGLATKLRLSSVTGQLNRAVAGLGGRIEDRLADPRDPVARSTLRIDLMWVEGVEVRTEDIQLPHPDLLTRSWALSTFVRAAENAINSREDARRILAAMQKVRGPHEVGGIPLLPPELEISSGRPPHEVWKVEGRNWPDGLAAAAYAVGVIRWVLDRSAPASSGDPLIDARNAAKRVQSDGLVRLEATAAADASDSEIARSWLDGVRDALRASRMRIATAVVYEAEGGLVRGAVIGERLPQAQEDVRLVSIVANRDPTDTRGWAKYHGGSNISRVTWEVEPSHGNIGPSGAPFPR